MLFPSLEKQDTGGQAASGTQDPQTIVHPSAGLLACAKETAIIAQWHVWSFAADARGTLKRFVTPPGNEPFGDKRTGL